MLLLKENEYIITLISQASKNNKNLDIEAKKPLATDNKLNTEIIARYELLTINFSIYSSEEKQRYDARVIGPTIPGTGSYYNKCRH